MDKIIKPINVFQFEVDLLKSKLDMFDKVRKEIAELWKDANEQWSETFGHDNPILEAKHEKESMLALRQSEIRKVEHLLLHCLIISEDDISNNKWEIKTGSIVTYAMDWQEPVSMLVTWITQGKKVVFKGKEYWCISNQSPIWSWLWGKKIGDETMISIWWKNKVIKIINIE